MTTAAEHFAWAKQRAIEYVDMGDPPSAMSSLVSGLNKHPGTAGMLHSGFHLLSICEVLNGGAEGARRFIEGLAGPADAGARRE